MQNIRDIVGMSSLLPEVYIVTPQEAKQMPLGVPYIIAEEQNRKYIEQVVITLLLPKLMKKFPFINWEKLYEQKYGQRLHLAFTQNMFNDFDESDTTSQVVDMREHIKDMSASVNLDMLMKLRFLPTFVSDIIDSIKINITNEYTYEDGYNKKKAICSGNLIKNTSLPNLIILDISGSIPRNISATMLWLIKTISDNVSADLILTSGISEYYTQNEVMQLDIEDIRERFNDANESEMFIKILQNIPHREYGNVFSFGDNDSPDIDKIKLIREEIQDIKIHRVYNYHTRRRDTLTGYILWIELLNSYPEVEYNSKWCEIL
jgi:hypothetical protein